MNTRTYTLTEKVYNRNMGIEYHDTSGESNWIFAIECYTQDWRAYIGDKVKIEQDDRGSTTRVWVNGVLVFKSTSSRNRDARMMRWVKSRKSWLIGKPIAE